MKKKLKLIIVHINYNYVYIYIYIFNILKPYFLKIIFRIVTIIGLPLEMFQFSSQIVEMLSCSQATGRKRR